MTNDQQRYEYQLQVKELEYRKCQTRKRFWIVLSGLGILAMLIISAVIAILVGHEDVGKGILEVLTYALVGGGGYGAGYLVKINGGHPPIRLQGDSGISPRPPS